MQSLHVWGSTNHCPEIDGSKKEGVSGGVGGQFQVFEASRLSGSLKNVICSKEIGEKSRFLPKLAENAHIIAQNGVIWGPWGAHDGVWGLKNYSEPLKTCSETTKCHGKYLFFFALGAEKNSEVLRVKTG